MLASKTKVLVKTDENSKGYKPVHISEVVCGDEVYTTSGFSVVTEIEKSEPYTDVYTVLSYENEYNAGIIRGTLDQKVFLLAEHYMPYTPYTFEHILSNFNIDKNNYPIKHWTGTAYLSDVEYTGNDQCFSLKTENYMPLVLANGYIVC